MGKDARNSRARWARTLEAGGQGHYGQGLEILEGGGQGLEILEEGGQGLEILEEGGQGH